MCLECGTMLSSEIRASQSLYPHSVPSGATETRGCLASGGTHHTARATHGNPTGLAMLSSLCLGDTRLCPAAQGDAAPVATLPCSPTWKPGATCALWDGGRAGSHPTPAHSVCALHGRTGHRPSQTPRREVQCAPLTPTGLSRCSVEWVASRSLPKWASSGDGSWDGCMTLDLEPLNRTLKMVTMQGCLGGSVH